MKRWTLRIVVCLVLGCVTTVAVAWGLAIWLPVDRYQAGTSIEGVEPALRRVWTKHLPPDKPPEAFHPAYTIVIHRFGWQCEKIYDEGGIGGPFLCLKFIQVGLPRRSMTYHYWTIHLDSLDPLDNIEPAFALGWTPGPRGFYGVRRALPLRPIWPGFVVDAIFYGAIWFGLLFGVSTAATARRSLRRRRGRCPKCGYQLRGQFDDGCSECGWNRAEDGA